MSEFVEPSCHTKSWTLLSPGPPQLVVHTAVFIGCGAGWRTDVPFVWMCSKGGKRCAHNLADTTSMPSAQNVSGCVPKGAKGVHTILRTPPPCQVRKMSLEVDNSVSAVPCVIRANTQRLSTVFLGKHFLLPSFRCQCS